MTLTDPFALEPILWPHLGERRQAMIRKDGRFVHNTSAANGVSILRGRQLWMRDTRCMNDDPAVPPLCAPDGPAAAMAARSAPLFLDVAPILRCDQLAACLAVPPEQDQPQARTRGSAG